MDDVTDLSARARLPDALRVLLETHPRADWPAHPHFAGLVAFWLDRHLNFRRLVQALREDAEAALDGRLEPERQKTRLLRLGSMLVGDLHGHHQIEDQHYFPVLARLAPPLARGFEILDRDHHALDGLLAGFTEQANAVLRGEDGTGAFRDELLSFERFLDRHLVDEEELIVPVILRHGPDGLH